MVERSVFVTMDKPDPDVLLKAWSRMVGCIGHELAAPLMAMRHENKDLKQRLQPMLDAPALKEIDAFSNVLGNHLDKLFSFAHLVQTLSQNLSTPVEGSRLALRLCLQEVLSNYPFSDEQRHWVHIDDSHDFNFECDGTFMQYLFFNLLEGALSRIERKHQGEIYIWAENTPDNFILHFKDTAGVLTPETSSAVFKDFFVKYKGSVSPGLGFCRLKLLYMGGDMVCDAVKDQDTHFVIRFPKI